MCETDKFLQVLRGNGHVHDPQARLVPLNGGVSSEIYLVEDGQSRFVVKRALAKLKVKDDWFADVRRNASEREYLECVGRIMPGAVPQLCFSSQADGYFGMEYLGEDFLNWKHLMLAGDFRTRHAELAGQILGEIHRRTAGDEELQKQFDTTQNFHQLRVEPYLLTTGERHPELRALFEAEARRIEATREALVHGDFSPKNILIRGDRMVLLDCEVAWYGDPVFDVAFLLNHLFLKSLHHASRSLGGQNMVDAFWQAYADERSAAESSSIEQRLLTLLPMLLLARVDGKSPVEYLAPPKQRFIRTFVGKHLPAPFQSLAALREAWFEQITIAEFSEAHS
ncbi:MAG: phosphotransferase [Terracidiphilus sp.]|jgi:aminoglycoside phosphotransferase (APT) family kinase protein